MNFLKGLALAFLGLLLSLSLLVFGIAFTLNNTALDADFINSQIDQLDIHSLVDEAISEQTAEDDFPEEFRASLDSIIPRIEQYIEEQVGGAIDSVYDYLLGESQDLDLAQILEDTVLNADFIISLLDDLDLPPLVEEFVNERISEEIPQEVAFLLDHIYEAVTQLEPWIEEQAEAVIPPVLDYLLGKSQSLDIAIPLDTVKETLRDVLWQAFLDSPPPDLAGLPPAQLRLEFNQYFEEFTQEIPATFDIDQESLDLEIAQTLDDAEETLGEVREYVGYFQTGFIVLIVLIPLTIAGIILINRNVRSSSRSLGIMFLIYGAFTYAGILIAKNVAESQIPGDTPAALQSWLPQLMDDSLAPLEMLAIGGIAIGVILLVVSFVYKRHQAQA